MRIIQVASTDAKSPFPVPSFVREGERAFNRMEDFVRAAREEWENGDIFVIDACYSWHGSLMYAFSGIRLLKLLRLLGCRQHCILYSLLPLDYLLTSCPHSEILLSRGTTYVRLPGKIDESLCQARAGRLCEEDVTAFFHMEALEQMKTRRHSLANWWGVLRVYDVLKDFLGLLGESLPEGLRDTLERDSSYQGILMNHARFQGAPPPFFEEEELQEMLRNQLESLWKRELRVVYVDDEASTGWSFLLQCILYGKERPDLFLAPAIPDKPEDLRDLPKLASGWKPDLVILDVRLNRKDETAPVSALSGLSLLQGLVSQEADASPVNCPILMFTASDKREVGDVALQLGADAVWTKEGVDEGERLSGAEYRLFSLNRFVELVQHMKRLTGAEYSLLYGFLERIREVEQANVPYWWESASWYPEDGKRHEPVSKAVVIRELRRLFQMHKRLLASPRPEVRETVYEILMIRLSRMLELFHPSRFDVDGNMLSLGKIVKEDWPGHSKAFAYANYLVFERNDIVHFDSFSDGQNMDRSRYGKNLSVFFDYLTMDTEKVCAPDRLAGTLLLSVKNGLPEFLLKQDVGVGVFRSSGSLCKALLQDQNRLDGVEATVTGVMNRYRLDGVGLVQSPETDAKNYWTAHYRLLRWGSWGVDLALSEITPRMRISFHLPFTADEALPGMTVYFYVNWSDEQQSANCNLWRICLQKPDRADFTYWTGEIHKVFPVEDGVFVLFKDIMPPFNAFFRTSVDCLPSLREDRGQTRICFLPKWRQAVTVENPTLLSQIP